MCVATGVDFPDAVTGGVYAASKKAPFILVSSALTDSQKEIVKNTAPKTINVFGGTGAVSDETVKAMIDTLAQPQEEQAPSEEVSEKE
jgi:putative cell wall-binding protein